MSICQRRRSMAARSSLIPISFLATLVFALIAALPNTVAAFQCGLPPDPCLNGAVVGGPIAADDAPDCSPIIIDVSGEGFHLTSADKGVQFDITGTGKPVQIAWTASGSANAFLALDRDHDGLISSGKELFGNFSPQPSSAHPNGFLALAEFDKSENGGNDDGIIDENDSVFADLRLWVDINHDGISEPGELFKLNDLGIFSISLRYRESDRTDEYGNRFRYRAKINVMNQQEDASQAGPVAYDVFLTTVNR
jgi:hypothetical protein